MRIVIKPIMYLSKLLFMQLPCKINIQRGELNNYFDYLVEPSRVLAGFSLANFSYTRS